ncbi:MAG: DUF3224 domain-containing protein, partial [Actinomycetota bacterium]|nr:DUF3224 domain-containing protein [Actinomycetota bacterium]
MTEYHHHGVTTVTALSWDEQRVVESGPDHAVARAVFTTSYAGDLVGESTCALLICYVAGEPQSPGTMEGPYLGYEQVSATVAGRSGTFVLQARGEH